MTHARRAVVIAAVVVAGVAGACKRPTSVASDPAVTTPVVDASPPVDASTVDASGAAAKKRQEEAIELLAKAKAFTDPGAVQAIELDCEVRSSPPHDWEQPPLSCFLLWQQSCSVNDPCEESGNQCGRVCGKTCETCEDGCVTSCNDCKASCSGEGACAKGCASSSASCRAACLKTRDKCASATCGKQATECRTAHDRKWRENNCEAKCPALKKCIAGCMDIADLKEGRACVDRCQAKAPNCSSAYCDGGRM